MHDRLESDDGVSLVETMVGLLILAVAVFALLGTLLSSAFALVSQEQRTTATRIGTELLEEARVAGFHSPLLNVTAPSWVPVASPDPAFTVRKLVEWRDAETSGGPGQDIKLLSYEITWAVKGRAQSVRFSSAFAPTMVAYIEVSANPPTAEVNDADHPYRNLDGDPVSQVVFTARPVGFSHPTSSPMTLTWQDGSGVTKTYSMPHSSGVWSVSIPSNQITASFGSADPNNPAHAFSSLEFQATAGSRSATVALGLIDTDADAIMTEALVHPSSSTTDPPATEPVDVSCPSACVTTSATTLRATVLEFGTDAAIAEVVASYPASGGAIVTTAPFTVDPQTSVWSFALPAGSSLQAGPQRPFAFTARYADPDLGVITRTVGVDVVDTTPPLLQPPSVSGATVVDAPIHAGVCTSAASCRNRDAERFQVDVDPGDATVSGVVLTYTTFDGSTGTIPLTASGTRWSATVPADARDFQPGAARTFTFVVSHDLGAPVSAQVTADVVTADVPVMGAPSVSPTPLRTTRCSGAPPACSNERAQTFSVDVDPRQGIVNDAWVRYRDGAGVEQQLNLSRGSGNRWEAVVPIGARTFQPGIARTFTFQADAGAAGTLERQIAVDVLHARAEVTPNPIDLNGIAGGTCAGTNCQATQDVAFRLRTDDGAAFSSVTGVSVRFTVRSVYAFQLPSECTQAGATPAVTLTCELGAQPAHWERLIGSTQVQWQPNTTQTAQFTVRLATNPATTLVEQVSVGVGN